MQYGVSSAGRPDPAQALEMLEFAADNGITTIDTASAYGEAEKIVGEFISRTDRNKLQIVTKLRPGLLYNVEPGNYYRIIKQNMRDSLDTLGIGYVDACLFHNAEYAGDEAALEALANLKADRMAKKTGVSIYLPSEFDSAMRSPHVDIIQIPYNILDRRLDGLLKVARQEIHARSVFLQGLLLMDEQDVPRKLWDVKPYLHTLDAFCERSGGTRMRTLLGFVKLQNKIGKVVFGADSMEQIRQVREAFEAEADSAALLDLADEFTVVDDRIIMPNLWQGEYR
jgi:aryl-alcohol dehydrogenase-like predicted oxidoreductase